MGVVALLRFYAACRRVSVGRRMLGLGEVKGKGERGGAHGGERWREIDCWRRSLPTLSGAVARRHSSFTDPECGRGLAGTDSPPRAPSLARARRSPSLSPSRAPAAPCTHHRAPLSWTKSRTRSRATADKRCPAPSPRPPRPSPGPTRRLPGRSKLPACHIIRTSREVSWTQFAPCRYGACTSIFLIARGGRAELGRPLPTLLG